MSISPDLIIEPSSTWIAFTRPLTSVDSLATRGDDTVPDSLTNVFKLQKEIVRNLLKKVNVKPSPVTYERISKSAVNDLAALIAFSAGLAKEDAGLYKEALVFYRKALELAPEFRECEKKIEITECLLLALRDPDRAIKDENFVGTTFGY